MLRSMKKQQAEKVVIITVIALVVLHVVGWWCIWNLRQDVDRSSASTVDNIIQLSKKQTLLETCYEHSIKPCTEEAVKALQ